MIALWKLQHCDELTYQYPGSVYCWCRYADINVGRFYMGLSIKKSIYNPSNTIPQEGMFLMLGPRLAIDSTQLICFQNCYSALGYFSLRVESANYTSLELV